MNKCAYIKIAVVVLAAFACLTPATADNWKKVESSEKNVPEWLKDGQREGTLMVTAEAPSLQEAREMAEKTLLRSIIQSVAANVNYFTSESASNSEKGGKVSTNEEFMSRLDISAAKLPFIKGVSLSEAKGQYWERRENKKTKQRLYVFTVLYPMPEAELARMRAEFEKYDNGKNLEYERVASGIDKVGSSEEIEEALATLSGLEEYFFDSVRHANAASLSKRYRDLYRMVTLTGEKTGDNEFVLRTELRGRPFATGKIPDVTSECASRIKVTPLEGGAAFRVTFSSEDCLEDEQNSLEAKMRLSSARLSTKLHI